MPLTLLAGVLAGAVSPAAASAQDRRDQQFYYPGPFNWRFLARYPEAARLFNAFDYGHAVLYEKLLTEGEGAAKEAWRAKQMFDSRRDYAFAAVPKSMALMERRSPGSGRWSTRSAFRPPCR